MPDLGQFPLGYSLQFYATTSDPTTGGAADATGNPSYRVYEESTTTALLTGSMAKLDDTNTTGFYTASIDLSAANGFELGKDYVIYIEAVVAGVTGTMYHRFNMTAALLTSAAASSGPITFAQLLRELAQMCGAVVDSGVATGGSTVTLVNSLLANVYADDHFNGHRVYIWAGTALGQERVITDYTGSSGTFTFPTGTAPDVSSYYIVLSREWSMDGLRQAFINALRARRRMLLRPKVDESLSLTEGTYEYTVPTGFYAIQQILRESAAGSGQFTHLIEQDWYYIDKGSTKKIVFDKLINDRMSFVDTGCALRVIGQAFEAEPTTDSATISVPTGNLLWLAASNALIQYGRADHRDTQHMRTLARQAMERFDRGNDDDETLVFPGSQMVQDW